MGHGAERVGSLFGMFVGYECADGSARIDDSAMYTAVGTCPSGYVVSPSHEGYGYIADALASWGYVVVSVNVNRGINGASGVLGDTGLNLVRGRMILKHLAQLSRWNQGIEPTADSLGIDLTGKLDFSNIGLMGHSRGGEGMRAAYQQYRDTGSLWPDRIGPATFKAMLEIGPVHGQTSRILTPDGLDWEVILPMCDGDVLNLQGVRPYDRVRYAFDEDPPPSVVIPGHSKVGAPLDATTAVDFTEKYLLVFENELKKAKDPESLVKAMKAEFPSADLVLAIERGAKANVKH